MIQIKKTLLTLVLLLTAATGAWAEETPLVTITIGSDGNPVYSVEGLVTLTGTNYQLGSSSGLYYWNPSDINTTLSATVEAVADNVSITKVVFWSNVNADYSNPLEDTAAPYVCYAKSSMNLNLNGKSLSDDFATKVDNHRIAKIEVYGAAAPAGTPVNINWDEATKTATFTQPAGNVKVSVLYCELATLATDAVTANTEAAATTEAELVLVGDNAATGGTLMYYVTTDGDFNQDDAIALIDEDPSPWSADVPTAEDFNAAGGTAYVWYYIKGDADHSDTAPLFVTVTVLPEPTYKVEFAEGTNEAPNTWTVDPEAAYGENAAGVKKGTKVTLTYDGPRKVIGVKAEKKAKFKTVNLSTLTEADLTNGVYILNNNDVLTGTLDGETKPFQIQIADGATVTLDGATINGYSEWSDIIQDYTNRWAGITCLGDATIILKGTNSVKGFEGGSPAIYVPGDATTPANNKTLTIKGDGSLTASTNGSSPGIGAAYDYPGGNINIEGGTITSNGGWGGAGIGGVYESSCGNITISGGTIVARGNGYAAGIGCGANGKCGVITITKGVTSVTAYKHEEAQSIGKGGGSASSCEGVNIDPEATVYQY